MNPDIFLKGSDWVALNGEQVLWLPPEARPSCSGDKIKYACPGSRTVSALTKAAAAEKTPPGRENMVRIVTYLGMLS
jgi:hypothetical protein